MTGHVFGPSRPLLWISWNDILRIKKADLPPASAHFWPPLKALQSGVQLLPVQPIPDWFPSGGKSIAIIKDDRKG